MKTLMMFGLVLFVSSFAYADENTVDMSNLPERPQIADDMDYMRNHGQESEASITRNIISDRVDMGQLPYRPQIADDIDHVRNQERTENGPDGRSIPTYHSYHRVHLPGEDDNGQ